MSMLYNNGDGCCLWLARFLRLFLILTTVYLDLHELFYKSNFPMRLSNLFRMEKGVESLSCKKSWRFELFSNAIGDIARAHSLHQSSTMVQTVVTVSLLQSSELIPKISL